MIKLIGPLFAFSLLYGGQNVFLLPDQGSVFTQQLSQALRRSRDPVLILTPSFNHPVLKKALLQGAKKGNTVTLITQRLDPASLSIVQYENVLLYRYTARALEGSLVVVGNRLLCTLPSALDQESLCETAALARCSDDPDEIDAMRRSIIPLLKRSRPYLER